MKKILKLIGINILVLCGVILAVEILLTPVLYFRGSTPITQIANLFFKYNNLPDERYGIDGHLVFKYLPHTFFGKLPINNQGFIAPRDNFVQTTKDSFDIFIFGGSTVAGHGLDGYGQTLPALVEEKLKQKFPGRKIHVFNAGVDSYNTAQQLIKFITQVNIVFKPDMIVFYDGWNDFYQYNVSDMDNFEQTFHPVNGSGLFVKLKSTENFSILDCLKSLNSLRFAQKISRHKKPSADQMLNAMHYTRVKPDFELSGIQVINAKKIAESQGILFLHFTQPALIFKKEKTPSEIQASLKELDLGHNPKTVSALTLFLKNRTQFLKSNGVKTVDLTLLLNREKGALYLDECHPNAAGNAIIAASIAEVIIPVLKKNRL